MKDLVAEQGPSFSEGHPYIEAPFDGAWVSHQPGVTRMLGFGPDEFFAHLENVAAEDPARIRVRPARVAPVPLPVHLERRGLPSDVPPDEVPDLVRLLHEEEALMVGVTFPNGGPTEGIELVNKVLSRSLGALLVPLAFLKPPGVGFTIHRDGKGVLATQSYGSNTWGLYERQPDNAPYPFDDGGYKLQDGDKEHSRTIHEGDWLYVGPGVPHTGMSGEEGSFQISFRRELGDPGPMRDRLRVLEGLGVLASLESLPTDDQDALHEWLIDTQDQLRNDGLYEEAARAVEQIDPDQSPSHMWDIFMGMRAVLERQALMELQVQVGGAGESAPLATG